MGVHTQVEIERKYDVGASVPVPRLDSVPGVAAAVEAPVAEMTADYFDTASGVLGDRRTTLRRRAGGADEGWHIKSSTPEGRLETHFPLTASMRVPLDVVDTVRVHTRGEDLRPVARLRTLRTVHRLLDGEGTLLAEFCDDSVRSRVVGRGEMSWREWEVELGPAGTPELLEALEPLLLAAGAVPSPYPSKLRRALGDAPPAPDAAAGEAPVQDKVPAQDQAPGPAADASAPEATAEDAGEARTGVVLQQAFRTAAETLKHWDPLVRRDEEDSIHQLRVAARTLRSLLRTYGALLDAEPAAGLDRGLRSLGRLLSAARDAEVVGQFVRQRLDAAPAGTVPKRVAKALVAATDIRTGHERALLLRRLNGKKYFALLDALDAFCADLPLSDEGEGSAADLLPAAAVAAVGAVLGTAQDAEETLDEGVRTELLHTVRKDAKTLRYAVKAVAGPTGFGFGAQLDHAMHAAKEVQEALGRYRDSLMFQEHVAATAAAAHKGGEDTFAYGVLFARETPVQEQALADYSTALGRLRGMS